MDRLNILDAGFARFDSNLFVPIGTPCRPRVLVVVDGLSFNLNDGFGLWRFLQAITTDAGVTNKPVLTLAHRGTHFPATVTIDSDTYTVNNTFDFYSASPPVTIGNYDQIWLFGILNGSFGLSDNEVGVVSDFMNSGGGMFATGDHETLGQELSGELPRIRHMREWVTIPMGAEAPNIAVNRIDTVVDPGTDNQYDFDDQSDDIPQRIYPNYKVTAVGPGWEATVHPLMMLPGAVAIRTDNLGFKLDVDVLPDHPHESVCKEVTDATVLGGTYNINGQNFEEFRPSVTTPLQKVGAEIVAYAVSGGRSVFNGVWKPPVKPQMFGVVSAYDGRQAQAYAGKSQRPGRIVCDSTWHHYVNINLDGRGTSRNGLGSWSGGFPGSGTFTPSAALNKIYAYYRNIVTWIQPANRKWCHLWWDLTALRFHPLLIEELMEVPKLTTWRDFVGLGREAARLINLAEGSRALEDLIIGVLLSDRNMESLGDLLASADLRQTYVNPDELLDGILGGMLARMAVMLPIDNQKAVIKVLKAGPEKGAKELMVEANRLIKLGFEEHTKRSEKTSALLREKAALLKK